MNKKLVLILSIFCLVISFSNIAYAIDPGNRDTSNSKNLFHYATPFQHNYVTN